MLEIRKLDTKNSAINLSEADIQEAFDIEYKKHQGIYREQQYESWKKAFKEYAPIIIMPLFRMICDYAIQHVYHLQQISWNENCYKDNLATQERHHQDNLSQQHELAEKHHKDNLAIQERHHQANLNQQRASADKHHEENKQINERHHKDNLRLQKQHNNDSLDQQVCSGLSNILGPVTYGLVSQTGYGTVAIAAGAVVSTATTTFPKWREWVIGKAS